MERDFQGSDHAQIISWHYNYETRRFVFIDADYKVWTLIVNKNMRFSEDSKLNSALGLDTSTKFEYKQVVGFGDYLIFSDCLYPATMGRVVVLHQDTLVNEIIGEPGDTLGEYLFISEDAPGGNIVVGIS